jgi:hypothetical protein
VEYGEDVGRGSGGENIGNGTGNLAEDQQGIMKYFF